VKATPTPRPGVLLLEPKVFGDELGFFLESYNEKVMADLGIRERFVQDDQFFSTQNVLRGLHYQLCHPQGKLVRVSYPELPRINVDSSLFLNKVNGK
jgi:dTDP-4-dehydrorhamnose 3,5-epimerase